MTYPPSSPGYPPAQQPGSYAAAQPQFAKTEPGETKLPQYLLAAVAVLGVLTYLVSYGPLWKATDGVLVAGWGTDAALFAALLAGVALLPKQKNWTAIVAVVSTFAFLSVIFTVVKASSGIDWGYYLVLAFTLFQAGAAITALLFDSGVLTPPPPKPQFEQQPQYGQYGGPSQYYGQQSQPQQGGQQYQQAPSQQRPGYPSQYGGYAGTPGAPGTTAFPAPGAPGAQSGPPTPPTGFPTYGQPQQPSPSSNPTTVVPVPPQAQQPSSPQSGPAPS